MRILHFILFVSLTLIIQYFIRNLLPDTADEQEQLWERVLSASTNFYSKSLKDIQWVTTGNNWKYLFVVPSRLKLYEERFGKQPNKRSQVFSLPDGGGLDIQSLQQGEDEDVSDKRKGASDSYKSSVEREPIREEDYFANSPIPRDPRPKSVKYYVGQVIQHRQFGYHGVIIGWDEVTKAPEDWIRHNLPKGKEYWIDLPSYHVLVNKGDEDFEYSYIAQENIIVVENMQIKHDDLSQYFGYYDVENGRYIARDWLQNIYPKDTIE